MKILIIGSGGREHALANAYSKSKKVKKVLVAPGNDFMMYKSEKTEVFPHVKATDFDAVLGLAKQQKVDLVDVAQDDPLALGFVDRFEQEGIQAFGPTKDASEIEWSKEWARNFMKKYGLPIPHFKSFNNPLEAIAYVRSLKEQPLFVKASGLALGKGAIRANNKQEAIEAIYAMKQFGKAGETFLIEECLTGEEFSLFSFFDGKEYAIIAAAQDHKTVYNSNEGPNTGGMGCVAPVSIINPKILQQIEFEILDPFLHGMQKEKRPYKGILYLGGMITFQGIKVIEFNARWGDPEAEVILPSIKTDYVDIITAILEGKLSKIKLVMDSRVRVSVAGASKGYPNDYSKVKGKKIFGIENALQVKGVNIYGAGMKKEKNYFVVNGGRIFHLVVKGKDVVQARRRSYEAMSIIYVEGNNLHYRTDIGYREVIRIYTN